MNDKISKAKDINEVESILPSFLTRTAHKIDSQNRVVMQGAIQKYIDHSISSTINLPEDVQPELISDIYFQAWKEKLKGVTIYRDGSRFPILSTGETDESTPFQIQKDNKFSIVQKDGENKEVSGDEIIKLPDGSLTTVYHYLSNNNTMKQDIEKTTTEGVTI